MRDPTKREINGYIDFWIVFKTEAKLWREEFDKLTDELPDRVEDPGQNLKNRVLPIIRINYKLRKKYPNFAKGVGILANTTQ